jgi:hypothetical protein
MILPTALAMAPPPTAAEREPQVPRPKGLRTVSPWTISTRLLDTPSMSPTSWANTVS